MAMACNFVPRREDGGMWFVECDITYTDLVM